MKNLIIDKANMMKKSNSVDLKKLGKIILKNIKNYNCYFCLDSKLVWDNRSNQFWSSMDGRGNYDIRKCHKCCDGSWTRCSKTNYHVVKNIPIFYKNDNSVENRINNLKQIYKSKLLEPEAEWLLYEKKVINQKTTELELTINIKKLADIVFKAIKIYGGNMLEIANLAKDLTVDISSTLTQNNDSKEIIRQEKNKDGKNVYFIFKMEKNIKNRSTFGNMLKKNKFYFCVKYWIVIPKNQIAEDKCKEIVNDKINDKLDLIDF